MTTMAQAIKSYLQTAGGKVTTEQIKRAINAEYPEKWRPLTLPAHLYACAVNQPKAYIHHPFAERFLYRNSDGTFELYSTDRHGPNVWEPTDDETDDVEELAETSISLERDIEEHLIRNLDTIEKGLKLIDRQARIKVGIVDILAEDSSGGRVIIEIKVGDAKDSAVGQIARYLGWYGQKDGKAPRGFLIASEFSEPVRYAAKAVSNLTLLAYKVHFSFEQSTV
jgi:endonuclease